MQRKLKTKVHAIAGGLAFLLILSFWMSTLISEIFLHPAAIITVKTGIAYALIGFIPVMAAAGGTGFSLGGKSTHPLIVAKRRRMPFIALNGLVVLVPSALFLADKANSNSFDEWFYYVQAIELIVGAINLVLMGLNIRDGLQLTKKQRSRNR